MTKLEHISGGNLKELEATLRKVKANIFIIAVNYVGSNWYIHYTAQSIVAPDLTASETQVNDSNLKTTKIKLKP